MFSFDGERFLTESGLHVLIFGIDGQALFDGDFKNEAYPVHAVLSPDGFTFTGLPDVEEHAEVSSYQPPAEVFQWTSKSGRRQLTRTSEHERGVWSTGDDLYWVTADAVYRRAGDGPVDKIYQGRCGPPHALGGKAVFACNAPEQVHQTFSDLDEEISDIRANDFLARQPLPKRIVLHDDSGTRPLRLNGDEGLIHSVRISHSGIAWFEFDEPDALCGASEMGRVMYRDFATSETVQIGEVQAPCYCCDHTPVPLRLDIADGVVAWNYAQPWKVKQGESESNRSAYTSGFAYATIEPPEECN